MITETPLADPHLETDAWHWLLFDPGISVLVVEAIAALGHEISEAIVIASGLRMLRS